MPAEPLFILESGRFVPSAHTRGPWDPTAQHGGAPAALVARALEDVAGEAFAVTRITIDLLRPVPLVPLTVAARVTKPGRRTLGAGVVIEADGVPVVEARGVAVRLAELPNEVKAETGSLVAGPEQGRISVFGIEADLDEPAFHRTGVEVRSVGGGFDGPGPAQAWCRLQRPVVGGEEPSGLQRTAADTLDRHDDVHLLPLSERGSRCWRRAATDGRTSRRASLLRACQEPQRLSTTRCCSPA